MNTIQIKRSIGNAPRAWEIETEDLNKTLLPGILHSIDALAGKVDVNPDFASLIAATLDAPACRETAKVLSDRCSISIDLDNTAMDRHKVFGDAFSAFLSSEETEAEQKKDAEMLLFNAFYKTHGDRVLEDPLAERGMELCDMTGISHGEAQFLVLLFLGHSFPPLKTLLHERSLEEFLALAAVILEMDVIELRRITSKEGRLSRLALMEREYLSPPHFTLFGSVISFLNNEGSILNYRSYADSLAGEPFSLDSFPLEQKQIDIARTLITAPDPVQLLIHGVPGTGKSEFARSLGKASGKEVFCLHYDTELNPGEKIHRTEALRCMAHFCAARNAILLVDEADQLLNSEEQYNSSAEKGWLTEFLDTCRCRIIWICNSIKDIHPAVIRRFSYHITFNRSAEIRRKMVWHTLVTEYKLHKHIGKDAIGELCREFPVETGSIAMALRLAASEDKQGRDPQAMLRGILESHRQLTGEREQKNRMKALHPSYDPSLVNTDVSTAELAELAANYDGKTRQFPLNILFWGPPGTGKTEFAKYLAETTGKQLLVSRASDLLSKYPGETEERIASLFREAEAEESILLLDEADSFFLDRSTTRNSWERTQTNEFLTSMENFSGVLICCTNQLDLLDHAVLRRFGRKVAFRPLEKEARLELFCRFFCKDSAENSGQAKEKLNLQQQHRIASLEGLTPGDLYAVESTMAFRPGGTPGIDEIIRELEKECGYRQAREGQRPIGFAS